ncbi:AraC family transcriptional regulator [Parabacteroides faecis]|uniref:helix-turn-helix domain-containing protein n=1 Tax=Parabacteroides TaxID=375288 RepID=UPI000EFF8046|nr:MULTISPECIES: helix-turn-helix domain-containing protein [Parabacteroides]MBC8619574.1 AraC family transcriptional regulator [Parabacteroides faecis]RHR95298.1 AraC family transcriptional regulator [Parabacteroides sp. AF14-59]
MKVYYLFLLILLYTSCKNENQDRADLLKKELEVTPILSLPFDSLLLTVHKLPSHQQVTILYQIACREEEEIDGLLKQKSLLFESLPLAAKKEKKKILLQLLELYKKLVEQRLPGAEIKGIQLCEELEADYSFSKDEEWKIKKIKASFLNKRGLHEQYLPIWFELLAEHRTANEPLLVIEDLHTIANYFSILGDQEKAISLYEEAYQLAMNNNLSDLSNKCFSSLIYLFYKSNQYTKIISYANKVNIDSAATFIPSIYPILSTCYLELQKPDSARLYLTKIDLNTKNIGNSIILNCNMADTYLAESHIDSALFFLDKAMVQYQKQTGRFKDIKASLPFYFLSPYSSLATLYQKNGDYQQAGKSFALVEPLMKKAINNPAQQEIQVKALARYSSFCRATKQYKKAVDLLIYRDSIQQIITKAEKERDDKNLIDRLQISDLIHKLEMQKVELMDTQRLLVAFGTCIILFIALMGTVYHIYRQRKKRVAILIEQEKEEQRRQTSVSPENAKPLSQQEILFRTAQKKVKSGKLYLDKEISLDSLAKILDTNRTYLSSCINTCSGKNFNQWINDFRIDYLLERIHSGQKLSVLAEKAGFVSTDSFYRNFKRKTNLTPNEYLKQNPPQ